MKSFHRFVLALSLCLASFPLSAQIKDYVGIVRNKYSDETKEFLTTFGQNLKEKGYSSYSKVIDGFLTEESFGSGFVYVDANGKNYIITNRHVMLHAASSSIEFEDSETGESKKYEGLIPLAYDEDLDIAILKFPDGVKPFKRGLTFAAKRPSDGSEVWSAGFPALGSKPMWQLGNGTVTNSRAKIEELVDPAMCTLIQHSAEIDSGNSGGPLIVKSGNSIGYEVVGVNTWKALYRQNTNYSLPAENVSEFVKKNISSNGRVDGDTAKAAKEFQQILSSKDSSWTDIEKFISLALVKKDGSKNFDACLKYAPSAVRDEIASEFVHNPLEGIRYATAYQFWKKFHSENTWNCSDITKSADGYELCTLTEVIAEKEAVEENAEDEKTAEPAVVNIKWIEEDGHFRIAEYLKEGEKDTSSNKKSKKSVSIAAGDSVGLKLFGTMPLNFNVDCVENFYSAGIEVDVWSTFFGFYGGVGALRNTADQETPFAIMGKFGGEARLPFIINAIQLSLIARGGLQIGVSDFFILKPEAELATEVLFDLSAYYLGFGASVGYSGFSYTDSDFVTGKSTEYSSSAPTACIYVKFAF